MSHISYLKARLKLKFLKKEIDEEVEWNFGYSPSNNPNFDKLIEERNYIMDICRELYPKLWEIYA